jgi:alkanesulfonate monooxygenase SsuD/methylene tetrahydromethanopterin reductase-like flavin-dependent oxidoreductase (luciferase family)
MFGKDGSLSDIRVGILTVETLDEEARDRVAIAAAAGLDFVGSTDHVCFQGGYGVDGLTTVATYAGLHPTIGLYVGVYQLPLRHPVAVARQVATLAHFAPGRLTFGVGIAGEDPREVESCGVEMRTRGRRATESLYVLRRLLAGESVTLDGDFFRLQDVQVLPAPDPWVPLIVGGKSDAALRRAATLGDGWTAVFASPRRCAESIARIAEHAENAGREDVAWRHSLELWCGFGPTVEDGRTRLAPAMERFYGMPFDALDRYSPAGTPEDIAAALVPYLEAGVRTFHLQPVAGSSEEAAYGVAQVKQCLARAVPVSVRT